MAKITIRADNFDKFNKFVNVWITELKRPDPNAEAFFYELGEKVAVEIYKAIPAKLGSFGKFMLDRTDINVTPTQTGFQLVVRGMTEQEIGSENAHEDDETNLWAMYEFHGGRGAVKAKNGKTLKIQKDKGGAVGVKKKSAKAPAGNRQGAIRAVIQGLSPLIQKMVKREVKAYYEGRIGGTGNKAARKASIPGINLLPRGARSKLPSDVVKISPVGRSGIRGRNAGGQFTPLGAAKPKSF